MSLILDPDTLPPVTPKPQAGGGNTDHLIHLVCPQCNPSVAGVVTGRVTALCGSSDDRGGRQVPPDPARSCVVCRDLRPHGCPKCGLR